MEVISSPGPDITIQNKSDDEAIPINSRQNILQNESNNESSESSDGEVRKINCKRIQRLSDSDSSQSDNDESPLLAGNTKSVLLSAQNSSSDDHEQNNSSNTEQRSRIRQLSSGSDSGELSDTTQIDRTISRTENKQIKLKNKFKNLLKGNKSNLNNNKHDASCSSAESDNELNSIEKIKQTLMERNQYLKSTLYDPDTDTSDEETSQNKKQEITKMKKERKSTKLISPKPMRMSAKDAMENMQKIKSESNRLLREKEVSLPYHRPKALLLKDIMSKRRPAVAADGKALPIKMNEDQLKHYVKILEERQKEVIQLCKSDTEEEDEESVNGEEDKNTVVDSNEVSNMDVDAESENVNKTLEITSDNLYNDLKSNLEEEASIEKQDSDNKVLNDKAETELHDSDQVKLDDDKIILDNTKNEQVLPELTDTQLNTEPESQFVLHYTENSHEHTEEVVNKSVNDQDTLESNISDESKDHQYKEITPPAIEENNKEDDAFSDAEIDMDYIDSIIENADIKDENTPALLQNPLNLKPKLTGAPGTVIDLDETDATSPKNLSGVELLKERYIFFSKLKTPEEMEREKEKRVKPGTLHLKLKLELEEKMAEQRSLEWSKRLEEEKVQHMETDACIDDQEEDDIEKLEAKLEQDAEVNPDDAEDLESEEELVEDDCDLVDKPRKRNPMLDDEAEVSDEDESAAVDGNVEQTEEDEDAEADNESEESSDESSESEDEEVQNKPKKGRILKAFEDSDDEGEKENKTGDAGNDLEDITENISPVLQNKNSQDDELQLAQVERSYSEDLFPSQSSGKTNNEKNTSKASSENHNEDKIDDTQSFSIMENSNVKEIVPIDDNFSMTCESQDDKIEPEVVELLGNLPQNLEQSQLPLIQTQGFGDDVLALCTGNFYDNKFVSQMDTPKDSHDKESEIDNTDLANTTTVEPQHNSEAVSKPKIESCDILKSILNELDSPEFESPKPNKFFTGNNQSPETKEIENVSKKKFVIDSDDEANEAVATKKNKKKRKKRMENRALQISDDEDEEECDDDEGEYESELDDDKQDKIIEYDSEENEVITSYNPIKPKKKAVTVFFEDEAELSSNEEWSGDEDERGLDRMEQEDGDMDHFNQGKLQKELGIIHMREVLDQDKREVRMIQELLFEDGDLGNGHRQRRFRWKNIDGEEVDFSTIPSLNPSQDDDFEMEEQWRKERYEREVFLKKMREKVKKDDEIPLLDENISVNMTTVTSSAINKDTETEKRTAKDIPSPRKPLGFFQSNYRGSLLSRGGSSLSRLAALAAPLVESENTTSVAAGSRNFVFATLSQSDQPKVPKRKANNEGTPRLIKKLKSEQNSLRNSLLDHIEL